MNTEVRHIFSHLGPAPYRYLGYEKKTYQACHGAPIQPGGTCDHCGTPIMDCYTFRAADGSTFHVGSTCVEKSGDKGLKRVIAADVAAHRRDLADKRAADVIGRALAALPVARPHLALAPHPQQWGVDKGLSLADWCDWMLANAGRSGKTEAAKVILANADRAAEFERDAYAERYGNLAGTA